MACKHPSLAFTRGLTSTAISRKGATTKSYQVVPKQFRKLIPEHLHNKPPEYPHGPSRTFKQMNSGLYGGAHIQFGNSISEDWDVKNRRRWNPNIHAKRLWSVALEKWIRLKVSTRVLRTIDKVGGIDEYLLGDKSARVRELGPRGWMLRWILMNSPRVKERFARERKEMGLPEQLEIDESVAITDALIDEVTSGEGELLEDDEALSEASHANVSVLSDSPESTFPEQQQVVAEKA
ncbi:MAG: Esa1p-associated factor [Chaenotheca gracillima]|nr:MAG: Esa1p-associated factor [Chaenotheca gracillima]